jgi:hypothetical protein
MAFVIPAYFTTSLYAIAHCGIAYNEVANKFARNSLLWAPGPVMGCADGAAAAPLFAPFSVKDRFHFARCRNATASLLLRPSRRKMGKLLFRRS